MNWRTCTDWAKKRPATLRLADRLGRTRGRMRLLDRLRVPSPAGFTPDLSRWEERDLAAVWIGHATVLLRIGGKTILTDPVFSSVIGVGLGLFTGGPLRRIAPALTLAQLPPIDAILISHAHFDHLDRPTLHRLPKSIPIITAHNTRDLIDDLGFHSVTELSWGESLELGGIRFTARPVRHWGARTFYDTYRSFNAYLIESSDKQVLYAGDTAYCELFQDIDGVDLAIFGIGAYDPYIAAHATPEQVWAMANQCRAERVLPMHHSTFRLSHEPMHEPLERIMAAAGSDPDRLVAYQVGRQWAGD